MSIQNNLAMVYLAEFERPLGVFTMQKLEKWPFLQELGFAAALSYLKKTFHGLDDFNTQMTKYSGTHPILTSAWGAIAAIAPLNLEVLKKEIVLPLLGEVGQQFLAMPEFGLAFAVTPDQLHNVTQLQSACKSLPAAAGS